MAESNRGRSQAQRPGSMRHRSKIGGPKGGGRAPGAGGGGGHAPGGGRDGASPGVVAVPRYMRDANFQEAPPGHRYLLYLPFWRDDWSVIKEGKQNELKKVGAIPDHANEAMRALADRQRAIGKAAGAEVIEAVSTSPFATGLGWEHPNENGFAFLHPYGLPYLAGSGIKGVLRDAAQELADGLDGDTRGWTKNAVTVLFGPVPEEIKEPKDASRGALRFFDVIPEIAGKGMGVDIMNPHYGEYYQGQSTPHDAGQPVPIFFLVVPPGSRFTFVVDCPREHLLPDALKGKWRDMVRVAFEHAFDWLGFGAKTAVGYGSLRVQTEEEQAAARAATLRCTWVDETIARLVKERKANNDKEALRGRPLAEAWQTVGDTALKQQALADIRGRWEKEGWWARPPGGAAKKAKEIYESTT